jgi:hypothetical protein
VINRWTKTEADEAPADKSVIKTGPRKKPA